MDGGAGEWGIRSEGMHAKRRFLCWITLIAWLAIPAQSPAASQKEIHGEPVTIGHRYQLESKILGETRSYIVHKPPGYDFSSDRYPVIILLDGDALTHGVSAIVDSLANNGRAMPMIVVGIENIDRQRDFTPPLTGAKPDDLPEGNVGGADKFLSFIADELLPQIDRTYRTRPTRILIGHSYGGLFAVYSLFNRPDLFKAYIAVSPALWWDNQALAKQADQFVADHKELRTAVYMTMANEGGSPLGGAQKVIGSLANSPYNISATFQHWPEETHGSVVMPSVYKGMEWLHQFYYIHEPARAYEESGLQLFEKRFALISEYLGYEVKIPDHLLMALQHWLMETKRPVEAQQVLQRELQLYPDNAMAHYELGRAYLATDDKQRAEAELRRALELFPGHGGTRDALKTLGLDPTTMVNDAQLSPGVLRGYVGEYKYSDEISRITLEDGKLFVQVRNDKHELRPRSDGSFYAMDWDQEYTFRKKAGKTTAVAVQLPNFNYESLKVK
jgi:predicted alpha/beta superfamily hydrolase